MPFKPGQPPPPNSGRKKGTKNRKKVLKVAEYLAIHDITPTEEIIKLIHSGTLRPGEIMDAWKFLQSYTEAKPTPKTPGQDEPTIEEPTKDADILSIVANDN